MTQELHDLIHLEIFQSELSKRSTSAEKDEVELERVAIGPDCMRAGCPDTLKVSAEE